MPINIEDILRDRPIDEHALAVPLAEKSFFFFRIFLAVLILAIIFKLLWVGVFQHNKYAREAAGNINNSSITQAGRGVITDRFGKKLTENKIGFSVFLYPSELPEEKTARLRVLASAAKLFGLDPEDLAEGLARQKKYLENKILLGGDVSEEILLKVAAGGMSALMKEKEVKKNYCLPPYFF